MSKTAGFALCLSLLVAVPALAQTPTNAAPPPPDQTAPEDPPGVEHAVVGGKKLQPHSVPGQAGQSPEAQIRLLQRTATDRPSTEPIVVPHDIYGNPLGGSPGANPPGLEPPPASPPHASPPAAKP